MSRRGRVLAGLFALSALIAVGAGWELRHPTGLSAHRHTDGSLEWHGTWRLLRPDYFSFTWTGDVPGRLLISGVVVQVNQREAAAENPRAVRIPAGTHPVVIAADGGTLDQPPILAARMGSPLQPLAQLGVYPEPTRFLREWLRAVQIAGWAGACAVLIGVVGPRVRQVARRGLGWTWGPLWPGARITRRRILTAVALAAVVGYGALLRLDAITMKYGAVSSPRWLRTLQESRHGDSALRPSTLTWPRREGRYISDPYTYLMYARSMPHFYAASPREPVFPFATRVALRLLNDQDVAVSFASAAFSTLCLAAMFLLGRDTFGTAAGLIAALAMAIEYDAISWGTSGWRDDAFTCSVVLVAWTMVRLARRGSTASAIALGVAAALACLVRITSLSFIVPGALVVLFTGALPFRRRLSTMILAGVTATLIVTPYLANCWWAYGDPLYAINVHADVYRAAAADATPVASAAEYVADRWTAHPVATADVIARGLTAYPFQNKWRGFEPWWPGLGPALSWLAMAGLAAWAFNAAGRLLLVVLISSLLPYSLTWMLGSDWRFTQHAYPFFLLAAACPVVWVARIAFDPAKRPWPGVPSPSPAACAGLLLMIASGYWTLQQVLPYLSAREALHAGENVTLATGPRDSVFFRGGWSRPFGGGNVSIRVTENGESHVVLPLPRPGAYRATLRLDPFPRPLPGETGPVVPVGLLLNGQPLDRIEVSFAPDRVGAYTVSLPAAAVRAGRNILTIRSPVGTPVSLWYVRVAPIEIAASPPSRLPFGFGADVIKHSRVNAADDDAGPEPPVPLRRHPDLIPGPSFETRAAAGQRDEPELPTP